MKRSKNLLKELNLSVEKDIYGPPQINVKAVKDLVGKSIDSSHKERKLFYMKKKMLLVSAAALLLLSITVFAASGIVKMWYSSSSSVPDYTSLPKAEKVTKDIGYTPVLIEAFKNGYEFHNGSIVENRLADENGKSIEKFKSVMFRYEKNGDEVLFSQEKFNSQAGQTDDVFKTVGDVDVYYSSYNNKIVPSDYKMTEEDKKAEENGELVFSWGADSVRIIEVQAVSWSENGLHFELMQIDGKLSAEELAEMAKEVITR